MAYKALTDGQISGTGTITCHDQRFGGIILGADGTNVGTVVIKDTDTNGQTFFSFAASASQAVWANIECSGTIYYSITGTNATAQLYSKKSGR